MKYENKELLLAKLEAINQLSAEATKMIMELLSEDEGLSEPAEWFEDTEAEVIENEELEDEEFEEVEEEVEEEPVQEELDLGAYSNAELMRVLNCNFKVKVPKNSTREKLETLVQNLVEEYGKEDIVDILKDYRRTAKELQVCAEHICKGGTCLECEELRECYEKQCEALIDDDGNKHAMGEPYFAGDKLCCCGFYCEDCKNGNYKCIVCGVDYELE